MAEPLTPSDRWRMEMGFGVAPDTASRQRAVAAGVAPLTTEELFREERGWGPSGTIESRRAAQAAEVLRRGGEPSELPEEYGGRPQGTTRRSLRRQYEWDKMREQAIQNQNALEIMQLRRDEEARLQRDQDVEFARIKTLSDREDRIQEEASLMIDAMRGAIASDGTVIANPIRPEDPNAIERLNGLAKEFKYGVENKAAAGMFTQLYNDALKFREERMKDSEENERLASSLSIRTGKPFEEFGTYDEQGMFQPKMEGVIAAEQEVKAGEEAKAQEVAIATETRRAKAQANVAEKRSKETQIFGIDKELRREELTLEDVAANLGLQRDQTGRFNIGGLSDSQKKTFRAAENRVKLLEQDKAQLQGFMFDTEADAKAAIKDKRVPKGAIIFINGKKAINR